MELNKILKIAAAIILGVILVTLFMKVVKWIIWVALIGVGSYLAYELLFNNKKQVK
ncbi:MAG: hypothetical protein SFU27_11700 [Thermonemataceae bacterium]|nr:hypothetical protein [Thermonemataceae bacterium]